MPAGRVVLATSKIYKFDVVTDAKVIIETRQKNLMARDYLRQFKNKMIESGQIDLEALQES